MAYQRLYAAAMGDPFSLRIPKKLRKLKLGKTLARGLGGIAMGAIPGGPLAGIGARALMRTRMGSRLAHRYAIPMGDPGIFGSIGKLFGGAAKGIGGLAGKVLGGGAAGGLLGGVPGAILGGVAAGGAGALATKLLGGGGGHAKHYRRMNPGNVRALRRAIRRVDSFANLAKSTVRIQHTVRPRSKKRRR